MLTTFRKAVVSISVDLADGDNKGGAGFPLQLIDLFAQSAFPVTWALPDPGSSTWTNRLIDESLGHELALLGNPSWVGAEVGRTRFSRDLTRRVESAAAVGLRLPTMALRGVELSDEMDLLVKHRISLVRSDALVISKKQQRLRPQSARFGIWRAPVSALMKGRTTWWRGGDYRPLRRLLRHAIPQGGFVHIVVDATRMPELQPRLESIRRLLHLIRQYELRGAVEVAPLHQAAARWIKPRIAVPSRSILRRVA